MGKPRVVFIKQKPTDKEGTVFIRVTENRVSRKRSLKFKVSEKDWNKYFNPNNNMFREDKKFPLHEFYNSKIDNYFEELKEYGNDIEMIPNDKKSFLEYWEHLLKNQSNYGTLIKHQVVKNKLMKFLKSKSRTNLLFKDITPLFLRELKRYLESISDPKKLSVNTLNHYLKIIKSVINQSVSDDYYHYPKDPFSSFTFSNVKITKSVLNEEELLKLLETKIEDPSLQLTRDMFLFQVFTNGMRVSDLFLLRWSSIVNGRIDYTMFKTKNPVSVPLNINTSMILGRLIGEDFYYDHLKDISSQIVRDVVNNTDTYYPMTLNKIESLIKEHLTPSVKPKSKKIEIVKKILSNFEKTSDRNMGKITDYKGFKINKDDKKVKELIDIREVIQNITNKDYTEYLLKKIIEKKGFIFNQLSEVLFKSVLSQKISSNDITIEQYKNLKHQTIVYNRRLKKVKELCKIETNITSHVSRHTFTNLLLRMSNVNLYDISQSLGHSSIKITENYLKSGFNLEKLDYLNSEMSNKYQVK